MTQGFNLLDYVKQFVFSTYSIVNLQFGYLKDLSFQTIPFVLNKSPAKHGDLVKTLILENRDRKSETCVCNFKVYSYLFAKQNFSKINKD